MKPEPAAPVEQINLLRQQVILSQVRIMELEDLCDELVPKVRALESLLAGAQSLADGKLAEAAHLAKVFSDLQAEYAHLRHIQHVTNEALNDSRAQLAQAESQRAAVRQQGDQLEAENSGLKADARRLHQALEQLGRAVAEANARSASRQDRIDQLDAEARAMKTSRSWRWTAWLRSLERAVRSRTLP